MTKTRFSVGSDSPNTVWACKQISEMGGNAVDIAIAGALAASFTELLMCSLGGSAFINIKIPGKSAELIDGSDAMPFIDTEKINDTQRLLKHVHVAYGDGISINVGHGSIAIPGMLKALELAWKRHGSLPWKEIVSPALEIARKGCDASTTMIKWLRISARAIFYDHESTREIFFPNGENHIEVGETLKVPYMSDTLEQIALHGSETFYKGDIAALIEKEVTSGGGFLDRKSLASYEAIIREPLLINSRGFKLALNPPPAIGGAMLGSMIQMYDILHDENMTEPERYAIMARIQKSMFNLRKQVSSDDWCEEMAKAILERSYLEKYLEKKQSPHTMHMSVAAEDGSVVSITMSNGYGSGVTVPGTGITFNNSLGEPELNPKGYFALKPGDRLVSNMSPLTAWSENGETLAMGSPGASRITTSLFQSWVNYAYKNLNFDEVVGSHRFHVEKLGGDFVLQYEPEIDPQCIDSSFKLRKFDNKDMYFGAINIAGIASDGHLHSCSDSRRHGAHYSDH